jgi:multidrug resistance efflux pump
MQADAALAHAEAEKSAARFARAGREHELRLSERLRVESADAMVAVAEAAVAEATAAAKRAALALERTVVRAPGAGDPSAPASLVVAQRLVAPGLVRAGGEGQRSRRDALRPRTSARACRRRAVGGAQAGTRSARAHQRA